MDLKKEVERVMTETTTMALATSVDDMPNVRILNFIYLINEKLLYFQSKKGDNKEKEFITNSNVAFTTIPTSGLAYIRVNNAIVNKSRKSIIDVKDIFIKKMPFYKDFIEQNGNTMDLYEVHFSKLRFYPDPDRFEEINLCNI